MPVFLLVGDTFGGQEEDHGQGIQMRIFLTGVGCVGKTTIGKKMGKLLGVRFFDLDPDCTKIKRLVKSKRLSRNLTES